MVKDIKKQIVKLQKIILERQKFIMSLNEDYKTLYTHVMPYLDCDKKNKKLANSLGAKLGRDLLKQDIIIMSHLKAFVQLTENYRKKFGILPLGEIFKEVQ